MSRPVLPLLAALTIAVAAGCTTSRVAAPPTVEALRAECEALVPGAEMSATVSIDTIAHRIAPDDTQSIHLASALDALRTTAEDADAVWWYHDTDDFGGVVTGEGGLIATQGCTVLAQKTIVIFN